MDPAKDNSLKTGVSTRSKTNEALCQRTRNNKRKAEENVPTNDTGKRSALGNLTNFNRLGKKNAAKDNVGHAGAKKNVILVPVIKEEVENFAQPPKLPVKVTRSAVAKVSSKEKEAVKVKKEKNATSKTTRRLSTDFEKSENSLYVSAVEDLTIDQNKSIETFPTIQEIPEGVDDFDKENIDDPNQVSEYAMDIFNYMKAREKLFPIKDYMSKQPHLSKWMRSLLIDWMVEVQESFELNHETLYLATKLVDIYLSEVTVDRDTLQLLGATSLLIASKFDERTPPLVEDFLYICDGAYPKKSLLQMEVKVLKIIGFDLGIPISYRFLRRYARCAKVSMSVLTLARYILEYSLMDYHTIVLSDSKIACAALFIALRMNNLEGWSKTLEYYTGYSLPDFASIATLMNDGLHKKPKDGLNTIRAKYSHVVFHEVAIVPLITVSQLFNTDDDSGKMKLKIVN